MTRVRPIQVVSRELISTVLYLPDIFCIKVSFLLI